MNHHFFYLCVQIGRGFVASNLASIHSSGNENKLLGLGREIRVDFWLRFAPVPHGYRRSDDFTTFELKTVHLDLVKHAVSGKRGGRGRLNTVKLSCFCYTGSRGSLTLECSELDIWWSDLHRKNGNSIERQGWQTGLKSAVRPLL